MSEFRDNIEAALQVIEEAVDSLEQFDPMWWRRLAIERGYSEQRIINAAVNLLMEMDQYHRERMTGRYRPEARVVLEHDQIDALEYAQRRISPFVQTRTQPTKKFRGFGPGGPI